MEKIFENHAKFIRILIPVKSDLFQMIKEHHRLDTMDNYEEEFGDSERWLEARTELSSDIKQILVNFDVENIPNWDIFIRNFNIVQESVTVDIVVHEDY